MFLLDSLSLTFLLLILLGSLPNIIYTLGYLPHIERKGHFIIHYGVFIVAMAGVVASANGLIFLTFWELMSLSSWQLLLTEAKNNPKTLNAARFYFFMTHFGFIFLLLFFLIVSDGQLSLSFTDMSDIAAKFTYAPLLFLFLILGFLSKAGVVPLHVWLPYAHAEAPSPVSALMSGVMLKVALYGFLRFLFDVVYPWPLEWGIIILLLSAVSSLIGVFYAMIETDIKKLLANSTIENIGIILMGIGMGMIFDALKFPLLSSFAFLAAFFHIFNHMSFKSLLFMSAGSVLHQTHTKDMHLYGGLIKSMPITALLFLMAALSISGLPPTNGFLSEWMMFQSLLASNQIENLSFKMAIPFAIFTLALTSGLAMATFVKAFGITFLGLHRSQNAQHAQEVNLMMKLGMGLMAGLVIFFLLMSPLVIKALNDVLMDLGHPDLNPMLFPNGIWQIHSVSHNGGVVSPLILFFALIGLTLLLMLAVKALKRPERLHRTWACGYQTQANTQYTATGFSGPMRRFFSWLYRPKHDIETQNLYGRRPRVDAGEFSAPIRPIFETLLFTNTRRLANGLSYWVYRLAHFEQVRYPAIIFNLMLVVLFSYRIFVYEFSWLAVLFEGIIMMFSIKVLMLRETFVWRPKLTTFAQPESANPKRDSK